MFGVERSTLYLLIKLGRIPTINMGTRLTRIKRSEMERLFLNRPESIAEKEKSAPKIYSLELEDCSIPSRQIGNCVYVPKQEIDNLYKSEVE